VYLNHFHFSSKPFAMNPDPAFLYASQQHSAALTMLEYAMESQASFCVLTGEIGSGKTTLIRRLLRMLGDRVTVGLVSNTHGRFRSIHPWALSALGIVPREASDIAQYEALTEFFIDEYGKGRRTLLIFDEAQNLSVRTLEELRLLSNVNSEKDVAVQTVLVGQPELRLKMAKPELEQFAQRVAVDFHLNALTLSDAEAYVRHRLTVAGGSDAIFSPNAIDIIYWRSGGIPRLINRLCDLSLVYAFAEGRHHINAGLVEKVLSDRNGGNANPLFGKGLEVGSAASVGVASGVDTAVVGSVALQSIDDGLMPERA
jgi:type II secretory pathway predicted ATPase ExeA